MIEGTRFIAIGKKSGPLGLGIIIVSYYKAGEGRLAFRWDAGKKKVVGERASFESFFKFIHGLSVIKPDDQEVAVAIGDLEKAVGHKVQNGISDDELDEYLDTK